MIIAIPSKGRAGQTKSDKVLPSAVIFVPESEMGQYKRTNQNVVGVPDNVKGITKTRNWILQNCGSPRVVFIDDDVKMQGWVKLYSDKARHKKLDEKTWLKTFERMFDSAEQMDYKIWGVATQSATRSVYPYKPFLFRSYVTASCMGIINDGTYYFDEEFQVKEDYEICLRHVKERGGILCARFAYWENSHWADEGGCKSYRTQKMEAECIRKLVEKYPSYIREIIRGGSEYSISLNF
jgi:hypothetical protein